ncbi:nucleotide-binding protein [Occallatibacter riparius]|uniref:AAA family ATPase n=1 Tax=Occallatibacter riparius TaxID=1002689 RepID=A0A9J7BJ74_9BACT|nr:AAA family ATPase [Occallatibacter riparius]UWZ82571.1 AAA family ATPase [Occallatibacter riparius]
MSNHQESSQELEFALQSYGKDLRYDAATRVDDPERLSVVLIVPNERRRSDLLYALQGPLCGEPKEIEGYPTMSRIPAIVEKSPDAVIVDFEGNPDAALDVMENVCALSPQTTVMVYSDGVSQELMLRCMRAGAREFLHWPLQPSAVAEALVRAAARRTRPRKVADGLVNVFWGAKGGSGVTTIATNFATAAAQESGKRVLLIDLDIPLGDAVLNLGLTPQYSTIDALQNHARLDGSLLKGFLLKHDSGLSVLPAPGKMAPVQFPSPAVDKLIEVARQEFDCVVVDTGSRFDLTGTTLFDPHATLYLVTQVSIPELRNSNRLISDVFGSRVPKLEVVLNRYDSSRLGISEDHITKALTRKARWKIPNDYEAVSAMQNNAESQAMNRSEIAKVIRQMARTALNIPEEPVKKKLLFLF